MTLNTIITAKSVADKAEEDCQKSALVGNLTTTRWNTFVLLKILQKAEEPKKENYRECIFSSPAFQTALLQV